MPHPAKGEKQKDFIARCIPQMIKGEGYPQLQATAICYSYWRRRNKKKK